MFPHELLSHVITFLSPKDIISLAETNRHNYSALADVRSLVLKSPYCRLELSQWTGWQAFADNSAEKEPHELFDHVELVKHVNKPLPEDFQALQGDLARQWNSEWNSCDHGISGPREDDQEAEVLDLTNNTNTDKITCSPTGTPNHCRPYRRLFPSQFEIGYKFSPQAEALLEWNMDTDTVTLYTMFGDGACHSVMINEKKGTKMHHLQLINDVALVFVLDQDINTTYYIVPGGQLTPIDFGNCQVPQEGLMMFNNRFFKAVLDEKVDLQVAPVSLPMGKPTTITPGAAYEICQDLRYPRYGLAYTNMDKNLAHVIDLQKRQISQFFGLDKDVCLVGLSNGTLGVWKYTKEYLDRVCEEKQKPEFLAVVEKLFENNENWEEFHRDLVDAWA
ncbi:hypothetical protein B0I72DRAFT_140443 [Yarrowia lipolytica]|uniref:YALI0D25806p n=2 Tax=Yarrowia lipolytica TaxID=4952 RepID=Q6C7S2_YARLI|nr:YALI0D25806p [Yarrowia lipolytica CLIB122]AOW04655.1 hypothetical protein YALI1_D34119g [Yarrowia lipolytica]KAB8283924.1 hypothetical protein BKA91DRAFT_135914 [Yarrowia lipolytica]KAE8172103.1 hypothetical protein BKA90DRAFT_137790 [Yarrowia lipolytica]KAJ8053919.1 hypothetical protein LXG23DRAFT_55490 [Yarrowia lipolytica]QNP98104.1 Hypothetical protein YALI2_D00545g [Yarrowia lipolytica]|eukprot:XP_503290.1 YALI0D25806p [Yarrowia lipolytica CLIB122]